VDFFSLKELKLLNDIRKVACLSESITQELNRALSEFNMTWTEEKGEIVL